MPTYPISDHCDGRRFFNPHRQARPLKDVVTWMRTRQRTVWPAHVPLVPHPAPPARVAPGDVAVTFIGHSTFLIRTASTVIITDPVFTSNAGPFGRLGPPRVRPPALAPADLPPIDVVLVSHNHYDHLQPSSLRLFGATAAYVAPLGGGQFLPRKKLPPGGSRLTYELDWWGSASVGPADVTCVPAQHFSARTAWDRDRTLWCGFVVRVDGVTIYFAGDSGYSPQFAEIGTRCPGIDVALIPIGAYEPRWFMSPVHMNPDEAVRAHLDVNARVSIAMHFGTFQLTDEAIDEPLRALERARQQHGVAEDAFRALDFGETVTLSRRSSAGVRIPFYEIASRAALTRTSPA
ncbi:MAG: MBL fold metallo-hydrolase [Acidobacteria bacterium]|nr:MBL fold metallo-hydrolase [Acidobacteriota bacterium]